MRVGPFIPRGAAEWHKWTSSSGICRKLRVHGHSITGLYHCTEFDFPENNFSSSKLSLYVAVEYQS